MRDKIVHEYNKTDLNLVWEVAKYEIPQLLKQIEVFLPAKSLEKLVEPYELYSQGSNQKGLAKAVGIASNAFADGVERQQVIEMLSQNNSAYQDLIAIAGEKTAEKLVVQKAEIELKLKLESIPSKSQSFDPSQSKGL